MSANPTPVPKAAPDVVSEIENILAMGLSTAFPAAAPLIAVGDVALKALIPYVVAAVGGKKFTLAELRQMQVELNSFGPSFPNAPGYTNPFAPVIPPVLPPAGTPSTAAPQSATITLKSGQKITVTAESVEGIVAVLGVLLKT